ncbi:MAG: MoxR family ATPase [Methylococcaceae bacterium]|nr:MAG: MoxR family ATPase [Methylococcaceae bacterium]
MTDHYQQARATLQNLAHNLGLVMHGQEHAIRLLLAAFAAGGHVLLEDVPGTGKTTLAKALARSCRAQFQRVQFTPDLLPADIVGVSILDSVTREFRFAPGPIFCHILLADEINRASPRTQSALLEAMAEAQVSVERQIHSLDAPFFVIATQNPLEFHGTYPLPEAQLDRFALRFGLGYVSRAQEVSMLSAQQQDHPLQRLAPCVELEQIRRLQAEVRNIGVSEELKHYLVDIVRATRQAEGLRLGASPRAALTLMKCAQALALLDGFAFVTPDAIQELAVPAIAHRIALDPQAQFAGLRPEMVVEKILAQLPVPA